MLKLWNYLRGYVIIRIEGLALESFINTCIAEGIHLWDIKRLSYTSIETKVGIKGYRIICKLIRRRGHRVSISHKKGYPFWFSKMRQRKMLIMGAFFSLSLLLMLSSFIFFIEVRGNDTVLEDELIQVLRDSGLSIGSNKYLLNLREIENNLLIKVDQLAWAGIEIKGIMAKLEVVEKTLPPVKIDKETPCDIVAKKKGIIEKVIAKSGDSVVEKGDIVSEGDLLITGIVEREGMEDPSYIHAYGEVYARTYYEANDSIDLVKTIKLKTGEKYIRRIIRIGKFELALNRDRNPYNKFLIEEDSKKIIQWRNKSLPVEMITEVVYELVEISQRLDLDESKRYLHEKLIENLIGQIPKESVILNNDTEFLIEDNTLYCTIITETLEDIAMEKKLQIGED